MLNIANWTEVPAVGRHRPGFGPLNLNHLA
jgi:hypothetical protein